MDTWTTIEIISQIMFWSAFVHRLLCIPHIPELVSSLFDRNQTLSWNDVIKFEIQDDNCPLFYNEPKDILHTYGNYGDQSALLSYMRIAHHFYVFAFILSCIKTLELCTGTVES